MAVVPRKHCCLHIAHPGPAPARLELSVLVLVFRERLRAVALSGALLALSEEKHALLLAREALVDRVEQQVGEVERVRPLGTEGLRAPPPHVVLVLEKRRLLPADVVRDALQKLPRLERARG